MMENSKTEFDKMNALFKKREGEIPQQARGKLLFIASRINKQPFNSSTFYDKSSEEAVQLAQLDQNSLSILFNTLVKTLLKEKKSVERLCKIKFNGFFQFWKESKILVNKKELVLSIQKFAYKYSLKQLAVANKSKSKKSFDVLVKEKLMGTIKFEKTDTFLEVVTLLEKNIKEFKRGDQLDFEKMENLPEEKIIKAPKPLIKEQMRQKLFYTMEEMKEIEDKMRQERVGTFIVIEETENMLLLEEKQESKIHVELTLKTNEYSLERIVNFYLQQEQWCSFIASEYLTEEEQNLLQIFRVFKKDSIFEMERGTLTMAKVLCTKIRAQINEQTKNHGKRDNKLVCSVSSSTKFYRCQKDLKVIVDCSFDGKGFYQHQDSCSFLTKWYKELQYFENNFKLSEMQGSLKMFIKQKEEPDSALRYVSSSNEKDLSTSGIRMLQMQSDNIGTADTLQNYIPNESDPQYMFFKLKPSKPTQVPQQEYLSMVINRQQSRYYRKYRFDQSILKKYDEYVPDYSLSELLKRKEYIVTDSKELEFIDKEVIKGQKGSLLYVIKQVGANIISGKSVLNVSLPVDIFEPRTLLERSASSFGITPDYLLPIADSDPLTQIKNIITLFSTIPTGQLVMLKPFNPILGQTFQAYIKGIPIYYEQISHHPPISSFYMTCPQFTMYGNLVAFADLSLNSVVGGNEGITYIKMRNGSEFQCYFPPCQITGLIFGDRTFRPYGKGYILEKKSNLFAEISIQDYKKGLYQKNNEKLYPGSILGGIFKIKPEVMQEISSQKSLRKYSGLKVKDVVEKLAQIRGTWFEQIRINNKVINKDIKVYPLEYPKVTLPSDANYRLDVLYHKLRDIPQSQKQKQILEVRQRTDKKLRQKHIKSLRRKK